MARIFKLGVMASTLKVKNIRRRPDVSLAIVDGRRQVIVDGWAGLITDLEEVESLTREIRDHAGRRAESADRQVPQAAPA